MWAPPKHSLGDKPLSTAVVVPGKQHCSYHSFSVLYRALLLYCAKQSPSTALAEHDVRVTGVWLLSKPWCSYFRQELWSKVLNTGRMYLSSLKYGCCWHFSSNENHYVDALFHDTICAGLCFRPYQEVFFPPQKKVLQNYQDFSFCIYPSNSSAVLKPFICSA